MRGGCNCGFALAVTDDIYAKMVDGDGALLSAAVEYVPVGCYNFGG